MDSTPDLEFNAPSIEELQPHFPAYEISAFIAQGGMGAVYAARQVSLDRPVAIKILPRQFGADPQFRASFESEAKSMARLNHPNLIAVYDFGDADGMLYIIMELVEGKSLHHSAYGKAIEQSEAARLVAGIAHGLAHAHSHGILHRDIKPGNIFLGPGAVPKIGDFGLARPVGADHNPDEIVWGTPGYSAPEVVNNPGAVDQRADIFAVGVLLYELLTAQIPPDPWQPPSQVGKCSKEFDAVVRRATHPSPEMRYSDAEELAKQLDELGEKLTKPVLRRTNTGAAVPRSPHKPVGIRPSSPALSSAKSKTAPIVIAVLVLAVAAVGGIIIANGGKDKKTTDEPVEKPEPKPKAKPKKPKPKPRDPIVRDRPKDKPEDKPKPKDPPPERVESTTQALARLKTKLRAGDLSELPKGTAKHGDSRFLIVDAPVSWQAASHFAEDHGAQLANLTSAEDLAWAIEQFKISEAAWVGLSDSGTEGKWYWVEGEAVDKKLWAAGQPDNTASGDDGEDYAALLPDKTLDDFAASRELPFLLQWTKGGNQGSLTNQLKRVAASLKAKRPVFPAGTRNLSGSRFLIVPQSVSWDAAHALAQEAGGHLAVPSSEEEAAWIFDSMQTVLGGGDGCWMGGRLMGVATPQWTFVTGERFEFITWAPQQPDTGENTQPALQLWRGVDGEFGYNNATPDAKQANYFLVEWSARVRRNMPDASDKNRPANVEDWLVKFRRMFADREKLSFERWKRRHDKNVEDFCDDVESEADTASRSNRAIKNWVDGFTKGAKKAGRVPADLENTLAKRVLGKVHDRALAKQAKIWADYETEFKDAQERYLAELNTEIRRRLAQGDREGAAYLKREATAAAEKAYFLEILSEEFPEVPEAEEKEDDDQ